jgi:hypothetical protein
MKNSKRALIAGILASLLAMPFAASAQWNEKPYEQWNEKDAQKLLNDSPWAKTQTFSNVSQLIRPFPQNTPGTVGGSRPPTNSIHVNFRIRFLSAKPVRQAISRQMELKQKGQISEEYAAQLKSFASGDFYEYIVVTVASDSREAGADAQQANSLLYTRGTAQLKNDTFLETKGGRRVFLHEFQKPKADGLGARFIFPRMVDGQPFLTPESGEVRFFTQLSEAYKLDRRFKVKDMMYEGKLEY